MTLVRAKPSGWALFELLTSTQMNQIDSQLPDALDGAGGGVYNPTDTLELDGSAITGTSTLKLTSPAAGSGLANLELTVDQSGILAGCFFDMGENVNALSITYFSSSIAANVTTAVTVFAGNSTNGNGGRAMSVDGGNGGTTGAGGDGLDAEGGNAAGSADGGTGVIGAGGTEGQGTNVNTGAAAGVYGTGGSTGGSGHPAGHGVVGYGGNSGTPAISGSGGYFVGADEAPGVQGIADIGSLAYGVYGYGDNAGVRGLGASGGDGGHFLGDTTGIGASIFPGASSNIAISAGGCIDFDGASSLKKNPAATTGIDNELYAKGVIKAWGWIIDGSLNDGYNIASVATDGTYNYILDVTLATAMASANYLVLTCTTDGWASENPRLHSVIRPGYGGAVGTAQTAGAFSIKQLGAISGNTQAMSDSEFGFIVIGVQ